MNAWEPIAPAPELAPACVAPFAITTPAQGAAATPLVFASPHSGRIYPAAMMTASRLDALAIRRSEDAWVDRLIDGAPAHGIGVITARMARVYIDVNRDAWELDPGMYSDELPAYARGRTPRIAAGLGAIARVVAEGEEVYSRKLTFAEARERVETVHRPYHDALDDLVEAARAAHGVAVLVDWHSMPSAATRHGLGDGGCDIVLGDRFGGACAPAVARLVEVEMTAMGYSVARNAPYAGGYTTEHYGRPARGVHALQIEVNRALYLDEATLELSEGFAALKRDLERLCRALAARDWAHL